MRYVTCLTTVDRPRKGHEIARRLVARKLAACVNVLPGVLSFYRWKKRLCRDREVLLVMKTTASKVPSLERELLKIHPYECPEFIVLPIVKGYKRYLDWVRKSVG